MKKNILLICILVCIMVLPIKTKALKYNGVDYATLNLDEALTQEGIEHSFTGYKENDNQVTIYIFRGNGCTHCRALLTHLSEIVPDLGKYFKVVSFEVWYDKTNKKLYEQVADFLGETANGVPFFIIGDKVFAEGYHSSLDEEIEAAIMSAYNSKDKYDVLEEMNKQPKEVTNTAVIIWSLVFALLSTCTIMGYTIYQNNKLNIRLDEIEKNLKQQKKSK